jgi:fumarate reductase subunit D
MKDVRIIFLLTTLAVWGGWLHSMKHGLQDAL